MQWLEKHLVNIAGIGGVLLSVYYGTLFYLAAVPPSVLA